MPTITQAVELEKRFPDLVLQRKFVDAGVEVRSYRGSEGRLSVRIVEGRCTLLADSKLIAKGAVLEATFFPVTELPLSKFKLPKRSYSKSEEDDNPTVHLTSTTLGFDYAMQGRKVIHVTVFLGGPGRGSEKCVADQK